ncbi:21 kDa protein [Gossypium raimondii]|uniref:Pectinesterase inhibitor domain-containing protein n=1 Tax=Gossypium raimondii TaxID=29730 RepID=A0A0D2T1X8_GOSRA|nr:21 kDa protein [Gossypium raimondii]KJB37555.1 hypothetical protein B456_006G212100 [Gossypium raimondii]
MARKVSIFALIFLIIVLQLCSYFNPCSASNGYNHRKSKEFIKKSCRATSYPKLCLKSLARPASKIKGNPELLASAALSTTFFAAQTTSRLLKDTSRIHSLKPNEVAAMVDCIADLSDSVQKLQMSTKVMDEGTKNNDVVRVDGSDDVVRVQINDIQMWVNMALEEEETCMIALANMNVKGRVKKGIRKRIVKVAHLTSNALDLVKNFALAHNK